MKILEEDREDKKNTCHRNIILILHNLHPLNLFKFVSDIEVQFGILLDIDSKSEESCLKPPIKVFRIDTPEEIYQVREYLKSRET